MHIVHSLFLHVHSCFICSKKYFIKAYLKNFKLILLLENSNNNDTESESYSYKELHQIFFGNSKYRLKGVQYSCITYTNCRFFLCFIVMIVIFSWYFIKKFHLKIRKCGMITKNASWVVKVVKNHPQHDCQ